MSQQFILGKEGVGLCTYVHFETNSFPPDDGKSKWKFGQKTVRYYWQGIKLLQTMDKNRFYISWHKIHISKYIMWKKNYEVGDMNCDIKKWDKYLLSVRYL